MAAILTKTCKAKPDWKLIEGLYLQGFLPEAIAHKTGIKANTISVGLCKRGITKIKKDAGLSGDLTATSTKTRSKFAESIEKLADSLHTPPKGLEKQNLWADTLQKGVKAASLVHGWGDSVNLAVIVSGQITGQPDQDAIEVETLPETPPLLHQSGDE